MCDKAPEAVGLATKAGTPPAPTLPTEARLPINRCNLPAVVLGSLTFQRHPAPLLIDGVNALHHRLFDELDRFPYPFDRAERFHRYMHAHFLLDDLEEAGLVAGVKRRRGKADYLRTVRGWAFDPDGREAAVLKSWVESRFGLLPRYHRGPILNPEDERYRLFQEERCQGLYNTNALEAQLDLLFTYCQYELRRRFGAQTHLTLYRGVNRLDEHEVLAAPGRRERLVLLNNINSFTSVRERADEFGDQILEVEVPLAKICFYNSLLPGLLRGEDEFTVLGGVYAVHLAPF